MRLMSIVLLLLFSLNGCYAYRPTYELQRRASEVRVRLSAPQDFRLIHLTASDVALVDGEVIRMGADSVLLSARWLKARSGYEFPGSGETVGVPRSNVAIIEKKHISPFRTALALGGVGVIYGLTSVLVRNTGGGGRDRERQPVPQ
jgi:hypothetical protein